jgi:hypothetical protein
MVGARTWLAMARPVRIEYAEAVCHVMARGNQGRPIFADDMDRKAWLDTLGQSCAKTSWRIHAWVLMRKRVHGEAEAEFGGRGGVELGRGPLGSAAQGLG